MDIRKEIIIACEDVGILVEENENLLDLIEDSLMYVSLIVEIEDKLGIEIPSEYLNIDSISTINSLVDVVTKLINES